MRNVLNIKVSRTQFWLVLATVVVVETAILIGAWYLGIGDPSRDRRAEDIVWLGGLLLHTYTPDELAQFFSKEGPWEAVLADYKKNVPEPPYEWVRESVYGRPAYQVNCRLGYAIANNIPSSRVPIIWERFVDGKDCVLVVFLDGHMNSVSEKELRDLVK